MCPLAISIYPSHTLTSHNGKETTVLQSSEFFWFEIHFLWRKTWWKFCKVKFSMVLLFSWYFTLTMHLCWFCVVFLRKFIHTWCKLYIFLPDDYVLFWLSFIFITLRIVVVIEPFYGFRLLLVLSQFGAIFQCHSQYCQLKFNVRMFAFGVWKCDRSLMVQTEVKC